MCRRGHSERYMRLRKAGRRYCLLCDSWRDKRHRKGLGPLPKTPTSRHRLDVEAFTRLCEIRHVSKFIALELSGLSRDCLGAYYSRGLADQAKRAALEATIGLPGINLWKPIGG